MFSFGALKRQEQSSKCWRWSQGYVAFKRSSQKCLRQRLRHFMPFHCKSLSVNSSQFYQSTSPSPSIAKHPESIEWIHSPSFLHESRCIVHENGWATWFLVIVAAKVLALATCRNKEDVLPSLKRIKRCCNKLQNWEWLHFCWSWHQKIEGLQASPACNSKLLTRSVRRSALTLTMFHLVLLWLQLTYGFSKWIKSKSEHCNLNKKIKNETRGNIN